MTPAVVLAAIVTLLAAGGPGGWLDAKTPANWNHTGAVLPLPTGPRDADLARGGRCASSLRPPVGAEDRSLVQRGWSLVGPYQRFGPTTVVMATSSADGMCRPDGFQGIVFVNGTFAGTIAPKLMDARTDGSIAGPSVSLFNEHDFQIDFARYTASDPLCCPHATSTVLYQVQTTRPLGVAPVSVTTHRNPSQ
jgi:hypothetical protein